MFNTAGMTWWRIANGIAIVCLILTLSVVAAHAGRGCCSTHGGVAGCSGEKLRCGDGSLSPTCSCDELTSKDQTPKASKSRFKEGTDYRLKSGADIKNLDSRMDQAFETVADIWNNFAGAIPTINHGRDGIHPPPGEKLSPRKI